jgi:hypothetical protein
MTQAPHMPRRLRHPSWRTSRAPSQTRSRRACEGGLWRQPARLRFEEDLTQAEIGTLLGVSKMQVSRILRRTLDRLCEVAEHEPRAA